jgi:hypothetical protein
LREPALPKYGDWVEGMQGNCGEAAIEQESGETIEESKIAGCSPAVYLLLSTF